MEVVELSTVHGRDSDPSVIVAIDSHEIIVTGIVEGIVIVTMIVPFELMVIGEKVMTNVFS